MESESKPESESAVLGLESEWEYKLIQFDRLRLRLEFQTTFQHLKQLLWSRSIDELIITLKGKGLTFRPHIDNSVKKANRTLGLLIRSFQAPKFGGYINLSSVRVSYFAHVRSLLEYCSVVWAGAAKTHTDRLERVQHRFLIWLKCALPPACRLSKP